MTEFKKKMKSLDGSPWNHINLICNNEGNSLKKYKIEFLTFFFTSMLSKNNDSINFHCNIPKENLPFFFEKNEIFTEDYILRTLGDKLSTLERTMYGELSSKETHGKIELQSCGTTILSRSSIKYNSSTKELELFFRIKFPLKNNKIVSKTSIQYITRLTYLIRETICTIDANDFLKREEVYENQLIIREYLIKNGYVCFIGNGSVLPRFNGTDIIDKDATPFISPKSLEITIPVSKDKNIKGLGIKKGITSIIGGAFSGKSTLLNAIEHGVYNHILGDGREYCISTVTTIRVSSEDGRYINNMNISPFFKDDEKFETNNFSTLAASGSLSQAVNVLEAINGGAKLILIEEDSSATNFLIKDEKMRKIIRNESIIPLTDIITSLIDDELSFIIVTGATSQFLNLSNLIIEFDKFNCYDSSNIINKQGFINAFEHLNIKDINWKCPRLINIKNNDVNFLFFQKINIVTNNIVFIDNFEVNIHNLTIIQNKYQIYTLCFAVMHLLGNPKYMNVELIENCINVIKLFNTDIWCNVTLSRVYKYEYFFEEVRPIDVYCFINRMRGIIFEKN